MVAAVQITHDILLAHTTPLSLSPYLPPFLFLQTYTLPRYAQLFSPPPFPCRKLPRLRPFARFSLQLAIASLSQEREGGGWGTSPEAWAVAYKGAGQLGPDMDLDDVRAIMRGLRDPLGHASSPDMLAVLRFRTASVLSVYVLTSVRL
jgi:hypothetical protein